MGEEIPRTCNQSFTTNSVTTCHSTVSGTYQYVLSTSDGSDTPQIVRRRFGFSPIVADCRICSQVFGKPNGNWDTREIDDFKTFKTIISFGPSAFPLQIPYLASSAWKLHSAFQLHSTACSAARAGKRAAMDGSIQILTLKVNLY